MLKDEIQEGETKGKEELEKVPRLSVHAKIRALLWVPDTISVIKSPGRAKAGS